MISVRPICAHSCVTHLILGSASGSCGTSIKIRGGEDMLKAEVPLTPYIDGKLHLCRHVFHCREDTRVHP